ncbi:MAG: hypothetical protein MAG581_02507 [Deltaproteobacteria bacterium]|jgi:hypothetical protein|nr:hypothetical protein [Deltaproteobacteria bacterium]
MKIKRFLIFFAALIIISDAEISVNAATLNFGLGPLEIRPQFLVNHQFLALYPENTLTLKNGESKLSYGIEMANTFVNTQGATGQITKKEVSRGLTIDDFKDLDGNTVTGFSLYLDAESKRKKIKYRYGITDSLELKLELPFLSFDGGTMDSTIESVHSLIGISNFRKGGAYRALSERDQYAFYVVRDGKFVYSSSRQIYNVQAEPTIGLKWNISEGGNVMPAASLKLTYKFANSDRSGEQKFIRSGGDDRGYYLILSKGFESWIVYFGDGLTKIGENRGFASSQYHRFMALEHRFDEEESFVFQTVSQSSIFPKTEASSRTTGKEAQEQRNSNLSVPTSVFAFGYKYDSGLLFLETGFVQDYNNFGNEIDFAFFWEMGVRW